MPELIHCAVCNGTVSSDAVNCPHCGTPNFLPKASKVNDSVAKYEREKQRQLDEWVASNNRVNVTFYFKLKSQFAKSPGVGFLIDGKTFYGESVSLSIGIHEVSVGTHVIGFMPHKDDTRKIYVTQDTKSITVTYSAKPGFFSSNVQAKIVSIDIH